jgi:hypothetical protein
MILNPCVTTQECLQHILITQVIEKDTVSCGLFALYSNTALVTEQNASFVKVCRVNKVFK